MLVKRIFKGFRGEGKTNWLANEAIDAYIGIKTVSDNIDDVVIGYIGSEHNYKAFCEAYESLINHKCPIKHLISDNFETIKSGIFFTDGLIDELPYLPKGLPESGLWFITMSSEDFVYNS